jgi:hypothetical protein
MARLIMKPNNALLPDASTSPLHAQRGAVKRGAAAAIVAAAIHLSGCSMPGTFVVRPITVDVLDEESSQPLTGIRVQQVVIGDVYGGGPFGIVPSVENARSRYYSNKQLSSPEGVVTFGKRELSRGFNEYITDELIIVNFDVDAHWDDRFEGETDKRTNALIIFGIAADSGAEPHLVYPNPKYGAAVVFSSVKLHTGQDPADSTRPYQVLRVNGGLMKDEDRVTVRLKKR